MDDRKQISGPIYREDYFTICYSPMTKILFHERYCPTGDDLASRKYKSICGVRIDSPIYRCLTSSAVPRVPYYIECRVQSAGTWGAVFLSASTVSAGYFECCPFSAAPCPFSAALVMTYQKPCYFPILSSFSLIRWFQARRFDFWKRHRLLDITSQGWWRNMN